jgi:predicted nucleic acid-binding protein
MIGGSVIILIDTNVVVYAYDPVEPEKQRQARDILATLSESGGSLSVQVLSEFFWSVTRKLRPPLTIQEASRSVDGYRDSWPIFSLTPEIVSEAIRGAGRFQFPYWDALIWATAKLNQVPLVLSEDFSDGSSIEGVRFLNPFTESFDLTSLSAPY